MAVLDGQTDRRTERGGEVGMRLIDADAVIEKCGDWYVEEGSEEGFIGTLKSLIDEQPTVDAAPVVRGRWIKLVEAPEWDQRRCTVCGDVSCCQRNYCPNCGAIMDGDGDLDGLSVAAREPLSESRREMPKCEVTKDG